MSLKAIAMTPPLIVGPKDTVGHAVDMMINRKCGAALVVDGNRICGIITERDVCKKIVARRRNADEFPVDEVMTQDPITFPVNGDVEDGLGVMVRNKIRHLPLVDENGTPAGMLSLRRVMGFHYDNLKQVIAGLTAYMGADGPGG